ncbi:MAG: NADH-quinone oxidoreductase subunit NuoE [Gammaproteobacteria bacterium]|nr:NADH-quinone oxidoreductase subunit NuoE [Gammaproteobacteria bacterium]
MMAQHKNAQSKAGLITDESRAEIDKWIAKYPADKKNSAVMAALRIMQDQNKGFLTNDLMDAVAEYLEMPAIAVYEVATFYSMYELEAVGKHKICVCTNISCMLRGSDEIVAHLNKRLGIGLGETTSDGRITLKEVECLGACVEAPMFQIGDTYHGDLTPEKIDKILDDLG